LPWSAGALGALAVPAVLGALVGLVVEGDQRIHVLAGLQIDAAPASAIAAVRPALINVLLAAERRAPVPAVPGVDVHRHAVFEGDPFHEQWPGEI
jgi:hypothetical protein